MKSKIIIRTIIILLLITSLVLSITGCTNPSENTIARIEKQLSEKYNADFKVTAIETNSADNTFTATVTRLNSFCFFTATYNPKNNSLSDNFKETDPIDSITDNINTILAKYDFIEVIDVNTELDKSVTEYFDEMSVFDKNKETKLSFLTKSFEQPSFLTDSLKDTGISVSGHLSISEPYPIEKVEEFTNLFDELRTENLYGYFIITNSVKNRNKTEPIYFYDSPIEQEELKEVLSELSLYNWRDPYSPVTR